MTIDTQLVILFLAWQDYKILDFDFQAKPCETKIRIQEQGQP